MADRLQEGFLALPRDDMRRGAFNQPSKGSSAWITALSNNDGALCNAAFVISAAAWAGLPQPICAPYLRMPIRTKVGRRYGLALDITSRSHPGGTFDRNHDALVHVHADAAREAGLLVQTEVYGLLTAGLPPAARAAAAAELRTSRRSWSQLVPYLADGRLGSVRHEGHPLLPVALRLYTGRGAGSRSRSQYARQ